MRVWLLFLFLINLAISYNITQVNLGVWLSGAAYCDKANYPKMKISGEASDFIVNDTLYNIETDIHGFTGVLERTQTIYVVLRGSYSALNWLDDIEIRLVDYTTYPECDCKVHRGFYRSALSIKDETITSIRRLMEMYPGYNVVVTAHSYGASCGQLLAMELEKVGIRVKIYNYGQPRVGDNKYAKFVNTIIDEYWRVTHDKDIVPHLPPQTVLNYQHSCRELFQDNDGVLHECDDNNCEDSKCANQFKLAQTSIVDHLYYLGHRVSCDASIVD